MAEFQDKKDPPPSTQSSASEANSPQSSTSQPAADQTPDSQNPAPAVKIPKFPQFKFSVSFQPTIGLVDPRVGGRLFLRETARFTDKTALSLSVGGEGSYHPSNSAQASNKAARSVAAVELEHRLPNIIGKEVYGFVGSAFGDDPRPERNFSTIDRPNRVNGVIGFRTGSLLKETVNFDTKHLGHFELGPQDVRVDGIVAAGVETYTLSMRLRGTLLKSSLFGSVAPYVEPRKSDKEAGTLWGVRYTLPEALTDKIKKEAHSYIKAPVDDPANPEPPPNAVKRHLRKVFDRKKEPDKKD